MSDYKVGDRVQKNVLVDGKLSFRTGAISDVVMETVERKFRDFYSRQEKTVTETELKSIAVKWDDGQEEPDVQIWDLYPEDTPLEREFRIKADEVNDLIQAKLDLASKALSEAEDIAEEHGISFHSHISPLGQTYQASSTNKKWPGLDSEFMREVTASGEYDGWQHSAVC